MPTATAATLPFVMATSRTALTLFLASMTWPPFKSRSYCCCAAAWPVQERTTDNPNANLFITIASTPSILVPPGSPLRSQVLTHVEGARHLVAGDRAGKTEAQRVAVPFGVRAGDLHARALDGAGQIA